MKLHNTIFIFLFFSILSIQKVNAQLYDNCENAFEISQVMNYCSSRAAFSTNGATPSLPELFICIPNENTARDIWFRFTAVANFVSMQVIGDAANNNGGTLAKPQLVLFSGNCNGLTEVNCISDAFGTNEIEIFAGPLEIGATYYISVSARDNNTGTFQLCLNNYNQVFLPKSDCKNAQVLCDKSSVYIENVVGEGDDINEVATNTCIREEFSSSWYRWTCMESGTLTLTLTPLKKEDDLDFAIFELPGGIDDCSNKNMIRCMAAGENVGEPLSSWVRCTGPTGLNATSTDISENPGCNNGNDNWLKQLDMVAGKSYALLVNNFSTSGQGYYLEFGGTGTFLGARADFDIIPETQCFEDTLTFINTSTAPTDPIVDWQWNFGSNANPSTYDGEDPPKVKYDRPGYKTVSLTITSQDGCVHRELRTIVAECCVDPLMVNLTDNGNSNINLGEFIDITANTQNAQGQVTYEWTPTTYANGCYDCPTLHVRPVENTIFEVTVNDDKGCISKDTIEIRVEKEYKVVAPNIITPNYDGINDNFNLSTNIAAKGINVLRVFNRWGACVYEGYNVPLNDNTKGWDGTFRGKRVNPDVFVYYAEVEFLDGSKSIVKGDVTVVY